MLSVKNPLHKAFIAGAVILVIAASSHAQNRQVNPGTTPQAPQQTTAGGGAVAPPGAGFVPPSIYPPGYPGYPYILSPAGSYLQGASSVISSQGQFLIDKRQAEIVKEQAEQAKLDTKRKAIEQWQYEQSIQPTISEIQAKARRESYNQMRGNPSDALVWSGQALNTLLENVQQPSSYPSRRPSIPLESEMVAKIKFTDGTNRGDVTLFAQGPKIDWPFPLRGPEFKQDRAKIEALSAEAVKQADSGEIGFDTIKSIQGTALFMQDELKDRIEEFTPSDYMKAKRFLNDLSKGARGLGDRRGAAALKDQSIAQVTTVDQLIASMTSRGLRFAPAKQGDEAAYTALYQSLRAFDSGTSQMVAVPRPGRIGQP